MLNKIVETKKLEVENLILSENEEVKRYSLLKALCNTNRNLGLIAEVKKASPSKGVIKDNFEPLSIAKEYEQANADSLSVLTDEQYFKGHPTYLTQIKKKVNIPVLRKDFIISTKQIEQSKRIGADAILLIAAILERNQLHEFYLESYEKGMECLVEVHSIEDIEKVLSTFSPEILGINNRNLKTFETNIDHTIEIVKQLPEDLFVVSESGISTASDLKKLEGFANAILVGETLMRAPTPQLGIKTLFGESANETSTFA
ncbi:indole-3-glycerol phosphate synthase [Anaerobacillus arseniciselenatis]|uniref:Indole-3-glycerol phosphate synthase n=1 Tax=Anaerobacillus arseniciselenatis TaxID=85682 RepID=A0A1S2LWW6_9BACI|nr:indole-3-glycerol phosphate synthase TrpC [Anaerobacillus arseniciselenatis]OIJ15845.1 indole-3-glycerol phosphate synthase [Anaerobacillus arseniciselenatis]